MDKFLHIISFDVPYPPNYGGVIDVFYKLMNLHQAGVKIILHCMEYGRGEQKELEKYCHSVHYYKRKTGFLHQLSPVPYIVKSRGSEEMMANLLKDEHPILFEGLHTCYYLNDTRLAKRKKIYRESNIEHHYYKYLAKAEKNGLKKLYFITEARKLQSFQKQLAYADLMFVVSTADQKYLQSQFPSQKIEYLPSFHPYNEIKSKTGKGDYILYQGNLGVSENIKALGFLIPEVFSKVSFPVVIAGLSPAKELFKWIKPYTHIRLIADPGTTEMQNLLENAHIHCLYTHQATGLKLKLLNVLYSGRFCICNSNMLEGTSLESACVVSNSSTEIVQSVKQCLELSFTDEMISKRKKDLEPFGNLMKTKRLVRDIS